MLALGHAVDSDNTESMVSYCKTHNAALCVLALSPGSVCVLTVTKSILGNTHSSCKNFSFWIWCHNHGCSRAWIWLASTTTTALYNSHKAVYIVCPLQCGFMAYHFISVVLVLGVATTCWRQIQKVMFVVLLCVLHTLSIYSCWCKLTSVRYSWGLVQWQCRTSSTVKWYCCTYNIAFHKALVNSIQNFMY